MEAILLFKVKAQAPRLPAAEGNYTPTLSPSSSMLRQDF
jgi:hypothetical protein